MTGPSAPRRAGRPRDPDKAVAILDAGWSLFLERGVEATPVDAIAARAGVSKVTLYRHYPDKTALFRAAVRREMDRIEAARHGPEDAAASVPIGDQLAAFGLALMEFLTSKPATDFYSVVAGDLRRHRDLATSFYELGPGQTRATLTGLIAAAAARGELSAPDPAQAAEDLFGLWQGFTNFQFALDIGVEAIRDGLAARVAHGVAMFLRLYGPAQPADTGEQSSTRQPFRSRT